MLNSDLTRNFPESFAKATMALTETVLLAAQELQGFWSPWDSHVVNGRLRVGLKI